MERSFVGVQHLMLEENSIADKALAAVTALKLCLGPLVVNCAGVKGDM